MYNTVTQASPKMLWIVLKFNFRMSPVVQSSPVIVDSPREAKLHKKLESALVSIVAMLFHIAKLLES